MLLILSWMSVYFLCLDLILISPKKFYLQMQDHVQTWFYFEFIDVLQAFFGRTCAINKNVKINVTLFSTSNKLNQINLKENSNGTNIAIKTFKTFLIDNNNRINCDLQTYLRKWINEIAKRVTTCITHITAIVYLTN